MSTGCKEIDWFSYVHTAEILSVKWCLIVMPDP